MKDLRYDYFVTLCSAIEATTVAIERRDPGAFTHRGQTLRYALERHLYIELIDDEPVYELFRDVRTGRPTQPVGVGSQIAVEVARLTCGTDEVVRAKRPAAPGAKLRAALRRLLRPAVVPAQEPPAEERPVCLVLHHPKFLRFVRSVVELLPPGTAAVLSDSPALRAPSEQIGLHFAPLEAGAARVKATGLAEHPYLAAALDHLVEELGRLRARCVVVVEGNHPLDEIANRAAKLLGIPCVCLQQGWSPIVHNGFRNMSFSRMFVWGDGFAELLACENPEQAFVVTGSPVLAADAGGRLAAELGGRKAVAFFLQTTSRLIAPEHLEQMNALIREAARRFPDFMVLVREHPGSPLPVEPAGDAGNIVLVPPSTYELRDVLSASTVAVSIYSTTLLEAAAMLVTPVAYNMTSLPRFSPDLDAARAGVEVRDGDSALDAIGRLLDDETYRARFVAGMTEVRERYFAGADGRAAERIAAEIRSLAVPVHDE